jgi:hypothetical protein
VEHLDLPSQGIPQGIPSELLDGVFQRSHRQICDELSVDPISVLGFASLLSMQDRQIQRRILLLLSDRWAELKSFIFDLKLGQLWVTVGPAHLDAVPAFDLRLRHVAGNCVIAIAGQAIDAGSYEEMSADLVPVQNNS